MAYGFSRLVLAWALVACGSEQHSPGGAAGGGAAGASEAGGEGNGAGASNPGSGGAKAGSSGGGADAQGGATDPGNAGAGGEGTPSTKLCSTAQPFGAPKPLTKLNTAEHEAGPRLTSDELTMVYLCGDLLALCIAERATRSDDFLLTQLGLTHDAGVAWLSDDAKVAFYENDSTSELYFSQRSSSSAPFPDGQVLPAVSGLGNPFVIGGKDGELYLSDSFPGDLFVAKLTSWVPAAAVPVPGGSTTERDVRPVLTPDGLTMYFGSSQATGTNLDIWVKERKSRQAEFGPPVNVSELNSDEDEFPGWISPDNCRIYFDSGVDTGSLQRDLYVAERAP